MKRAGASNTKIVQHDQQFEETGSGRPPISQLSYRAPQLPHSAKTLSAKSLGSARVIQQPADSTLRSAGFTDRTLSGRKTQPHSAQSTKPPLPHSSKSRPTTSKSGISAHSVTIKDDEIEMEEPHEWREPFRIQRRVSWAFEQPIVPKAKDISLSETKSLLRSQMRMKAESVNPPDFVYLTVNAIQQSMKASEVSANTQLNMMDNKKIQLNTRLRENRPSSSPSKIDPRTRVAPETIDLSQFRDIIEEDTWSEVSDLKSVKSTKSKDSIPPTSDKEIYATKCEVKTLKTAPKISVHPKRIHTTLPKGRVIRPISASVIRKDDEPKSKGSRPITAPTQRARPNTASSLPSQIAMSMPGAQPPRKKHAHISTTGYEANLVPMLMYPADMKEKLATLLKEKRQQRHDDHLESASEMGLGKVSQFNDPLRSHVKFELRTHNQEKNFITETEKMHQERRKQEEALLEKKKRVMWTAKAKGQDPMSRIKSAPVGSTLEQ